MQFFFLENDLTLLERKIERLMVSHKAAGRSLGEACQQGAETFHDNAPFDAAMEEFGLTAVRFSHLERIRKLAVVVAPTNSVESVGFGSIVEILDLESDQSHWYKVGGYLVHTSGGDGLTESDPILISYRSPLGKAVFGKRTSDPVEAWIGHRVRRMAILEILCSQ